MTEPKLTRKKRVAIALLVALLLSGVTLIVVFGVVHGLVLLYQLIVWCSMAIGIDVHTAKWVSVVIEVCWLLFEALTFVHILDIIMDEDA